MEVDPVPTVRRTQPNSTSSLYIESTIAHPDLAELCFCTSLVIVDLIWEGEATMAARREQLQAGDANGSPLNLLRPRDIFELPSKRSRVAMEEGSPPDRASRRPPADSDSDYSVPDLSDPALLARNDLDDFKGLFEGTRDNPNGEPVPPTDEDIRASIAAVHAIAQFTPGCLVVALIYIERLRRGAGALLLASTWQPTLLISILVAQKVWEDRSAMNGDFTCLSPDLTLAQLNTLERDFLRLLDYNVGVKAAVYTNWYFRLGTLCERNQMRVKPLDADTARNLEIGSESFAARIKPQSNRPLSEPVLETPDDLGVKGEQSQRSRAVLS